MSEPDLHAIALAGGVDARIVILPTAAAPDNNHNRAGGGGERWFRSLGASRVEVVPVIDAKSANDPALAARIATAKFIYLLGGFPRHLAETLLSSRVWRSALEAQAGGAVIGGSSAGAMVLCEHYFDPEEGGVLGGLALLSNCCVIPHHNRNGRDWMEKLSQLLPRALLIGIDEQTGMLNDDSGNWTVYGKGAVTLYRPPAKPSIYSPSEIFKL